MSSEIQIAVIGLVSIAVTSIFKMVELWWQKRLDQKKQVQLSTIVDVEYDVNKQIYSVLDHYKAARVFVARFHNGGKYVNGVPMERFSITNCVYIENERPVASQYQGRLINDYSGVFQKLIYDGHYCFSVVENKDNMLESLIHPFGHTVYLFLIKDSKQMPIAFLAICFNESVSMDQNSLDKIQLSAQNLLMYLNAEKK